MNLRWVKRKTIQDVMPLNPRGAMVEATATRTVKVLQYNHPIFDPDKKGPGLFGGGYIDNWIDVPTVEESET